PSTDHLIAAMPAHRPPAHPGDAARLVPGRALAQQYRCDVCHPPDCSGQDSVPRLADQREDSLLKTLREYKSGARHGYDAIMAEVLQPVADAQLIELAHYLAHAR